jgi:hypothetical protein
MSPQIALSALACRHSGPALQAPGGLQLPVAAARERPAAAARESGRPSLQEGTGGRQGVTGKAGTRGGSAEGGRVGGCALTRTVPLFRLC